MKNFPIFFPIFHRIFKIDDKDVLKDILSFQEKNPFEKDSLSFEVKRSKTKEFRFFRQDGTSYKAKFKVYNLPSIENNIPVFVVVLAITEVISDDDSTTCTSECSLVTSNKTH